MEKKVILKNKVQKKRSPSPQYMTKKPMPGLLSHLHPDSFRVSSWCESQCTNIRQSASPDSGIIW
ncbi:hypothetical protein T4E_9935 [Trichinella pseudospiralis]|uniref:Uncharacterized protein n=1 Tax=Trichinella pseudospiralis TaxID=6337 RepID=A0A0V0XGT6_TRIPS|nr:hypothetical protein T4E_9935 [Trichinella pseudospiralis]